MAENSARGEIFVVDDDPAVRRTLSVVLSGASYEVVCFADGGDTLHASQPIGGARDVSGAGQRKRRFVGETGKMATLALA